MQAGDGGADERLREQYLRRVSQVRRQKSASATVAHAGAAPGRSGGVGRRGAIGSGAGSSVGSGNSGASGGVVRQATSRSGRINVVERSTRSVAADRSRSVSQRRPWS